MDNLENNPSSTQPETTSLTLAAMDGVMRSLVGAIDEKHIAAAKERVKAMASRRPQATPEQLAHMAIRQKCIDTGAIGIASSVPGLIPGLGSVLVASAGLVIDLRKTMEMQKDLVLELAAIYGREVTDGDRRNLLLLVSGVDSGNKLIAKAGSEAAAKVSTRLSSRALSKALPVAGIVTSAAVNVVSTYMVGRRAQAYWSTDPALTENWDSALRTLSGVDERELARWLLAALDQAQGGLRASALHVGSAAGAIGRAATKSTGSFLANQRDRLLRRPRASGQQPSKGQQSSGQLPGELPSGELPSGEQTT